MNHENQRLLEKLGGGVGISADNSAHLSQLFHENSKFTDNSSQLSGLRIAALSNNKDLLRMLSKAYKVYSLADTKALGTPEPSCQLEQVIEDRRSIRSYSAQPIPLSMLGRLLYFAYGRTDPIGYSRAVASGGALFPLELYVCSLRVTDLDAGLYHYDPEHHQLHVLERGDFTRSLQECLFLEETDLPSAAMAIFISGVFERSTIKYGNRGYRMTLMECGEVGQNLNLMATAHGLGCVWLGGFLDDKLNDLLGLDGNAESVLVPMLVGCKHKN
jgi:SagB-type dehydrogenase family enzyme